MNIQSTHKTVKPPGTVIEKKEFSTHHISRETATGSSIFSPPSSDEKATDSESTQITVGKALVQILEDAGVSYAFGISGGGIGPLWAALNSSNIELMHFRHESGAAFAAIETYFTTGRPVVVFTTTGPGITNVLTGILAARGEGAKVILLSATTPAGNRGRGACQETSSHTMPFSGIFTSEPLFNYASIVETGEELPEVSRRLAQGLAQPGGFVAHISVPTKVQTAPLATQLPTATAFSQSVPTVTEEAIAECAKLLSEESFGIWVGFGARHAAQEIQELAQKTGAAVMTSPRAKGIFPEHHPQYVGVTGFSGHESVLKYMYEQLPQRLLVLGTRLGEPSSFWSPVMVPANGFIHVDIDPKVPGSAYPLAPTLSIHSEIKVFLKALLQHLPERLNWSANSILPRPEGYTNIPRDNGLVRPNILMDAIQRVIVENSDAVVMAEAGNSFAWATNLLRFSQPNRYRISTGVGAMGHAATGVVGAALGRQGKAVAIVGDGAMLMNNEISTAVRFEIPSVWIVLNDGRYNMCAQGMALQGFKGVDTEIPMTDFAMLARAMGGEGIRVYKESDLEAALATAMASPVPFVVDVIIEPNQPAPIGGRIKSLISQGAKQ
ncbi:thiamine pyrophosphate-dependent enzyme [Anabaena azotica]|uniref:Thiamine pyrophosphate-binding protein n=1 Tax=Anabaena azotica FACHB-119 TaxID=947527 RepID=A0ABR8D008_9NOST|nr:thiamine pyrophosphate-dependent enzyme [Anabaena azotica]MBD2500519.1 thiamine pyrophosphate-binding protein [Anabaena azotica FACHB-119]